mgnify:CR=1 FL=1
MKERKSKMSRQQEFLNFWNYLTHEVAGDIEVPPNVQEYIDAIADNKSVNKPAFTENGKNILQYLQSVPSAMYKAKDIAEGMLISSKAVSGAMRKLVTDGYVEKVGNSPVVYMITQKGKEYIFEE